MEDIKLEVRRNMDLILEHHIAEEDQRFLQLQQEIKDLRQDIKELTIAWQQAKGVVTFIKWCSIAAGGFVTFFLFIKEHWK